MHRERKEQHRSPISTVHLWVLTYGQAPGIQSKSKRESALYQRNATVTRTLPVPVAK